jgi:hypothetical protein
MNKKKYILPAFGVALLVFSLYFSFAVFGQTAKSNCVITKIGNPGDQKPALPPECQTGGIDGVEVPPNLECKADGYCKMPDAIDGSHQIYSCVNNRWGSKELVSALYTVARNWKSKYPDGYLLIGDLNAAGHASHNIGIANDVYAMTKDDECVGNYDDNDKNYSCGSSNYNRDATIELGKMFVNTNIVLNIWYNDPEVNAAVMEYAKSTGKSPRLFDSPKNSPTVPGMRPQPGHANHFHLDVSIDPTLGFWEPGC